MNKINPLALLVVLFLFSLFLFFKVQSLDGSLSENSKILANIEENAQKIVDMKRIWQNKNTEAKIRSIFKNANNLSIAKKSGNISVKAENISGYDVQNIVNQILNEPINIKFFEIKRLNDDNATFILEASE